MLFGHQNNDVTQPTADPVTVPSAPAVNPLAVDPATGVSLPVATEVEATETSGVLQQPAPVAAMPSSLDLPPPPAMPELNALSDAPTATPSLPMSEPPEPLPAPSMPLEDVPAPIETAPATADAPADPAMQPSVDDLFDLKQQALAQLSPLVDQLEQTPEEEFRTTMMMIQSTDNQTLIKKAYDAAQNITDEKERAQALLDVINEINYFTQPHPDQPAAQ